jgi:hypothetical protein
MDEYASIWAAQHGGEGFLASVRLTNGMKAQALMEYAEVLVAQLGESDEDTVISIEKAIQAQAKAYALHNLPVYIFQLAEMYEVAGDTTKAKEFLKYFLRAQQEFTPDEIDNLLLDQSEFDMATVILLAKQKLDGLPT